MTKRDDLAVAERDEGRDGDGAIMSIRAFINGPTGPKTTHFWGPVANWGFVLAVRETRETRATRETRPRRRAMMMDADDDGCGSCGWMDDARGDESRDETRLARANDRSTDARRRRDSTARLDDADDRV